MATNPYTSVSISGYNSSPPPDAGETTAANTVEWAKHKDKLGDPVKTLAESINTNVLAALAKVINTDADENNAMAGSLAFTESTLTIATGSVTATRTAHVIAAETGTTDDLANITTGSVSDNCLLIIRPDTGDTITVKHAATGAGEMHLSDDADFAMSSDMSLLLQRRGADWYEIARSEVRPATQAQQETGTATIVAVTPGRQHFHASAAKAWVKFDNAGAIQGTAYGVDSVTDNSTGNFSPQWTTDFSSVDYGITLAVLSANPEGDNGLFVTASAVGSCTVEFGDAGAAPTESNLTACYVAAHGDL